MNKRGINALITIVLIVLIVLIAIVIIWLSLRPIIDTTGEEAEKRVNCLQMNLEPNNCIYAQCGSIVNSFFTEVTTKRGPDSAVGLSDINFIFHSENNTEKILKTGDSLGEAYLPLPFETSKFIFAGLQDKPGDVYLIPSIGENKAVCPTRSGTRECKAGEIESNTQFCADVVKDGTYDLNDINSFVENWIDKNPSADVNNDGIYDFADVAIFCFEFTEPNAQNCN